MNERKTNHGHSLVHSFALSLFALMTKSWIAAARPRTLPLALASIILGSFLAFANHHFNWQIAVLATLTTIFLQILSNFANDYGDAVSGKDTELRVGPRRAVATGDITKEAMLRGIVLMSVLALICGIGLLTVAFYNVAPKIFWFFFVLGLLSIAAAIGYTNGKRPYGYAGFGDIAVLIFFGWVGVLGTYFLYTLSFSSLLLLPATSVGLFATGVLNVNNIRDIETDTMTGKRSIPARLGLPLAIRYHWGLLITGMACAVAYSFLTDATAVGYLYVLSFPLFVLNGRAIATHKRPAELNARLGQLALTTLLFVILFGLGQVL